MKKITSWNNAPKNHGLYWSAGEMRMLRRLCPSGTISEEIANRVGRTITACSDALRTIRKGEMIINGDDEDTLSTWKKKEQS